MAADASGTSAGETAARHVLSDGGDDEWEYEYDANATEELYFTLDLSTHRPDHGSKRQAPPSGTQPKRRKRRRLTKQPRDSALYDNNNNNNKNEPERQQAEEQDREDAVEGTPGNAQPEQVNTIEFLDLTGTNPIIKLNDDIYSCHWMTDLGSQLYVTRHGEVESAALRGHVLDILGASQARLVGKPVSLRRRDSLESQGDLDGTSASNAINLDDEGESNEAVPPSVTTAPTASTQPPTTAEPLVIPPEKVKDDNTRRQARFLERLSAIKLKKGETDRVPISAIKIYNRKLVPNKDELRAKALATDARKGKAKANAVEEVAGNGNLNGSQEPALDSVQPSRSADDGEQAEGINSGQSNRPSPFHAEEFQSLTQQLP